MNVLINQLETIRLACLSWHYEAGGESFYGNHLLSDKIQEPLAGFVDDIKEVCFLGNQIPAPDIAPDKIKGCPADIIGEITVTIYHIEELSRSGLMQGELNILGSISEHLLKSRGFIWRTIDGVTESEK